MEAPGASFPVAMKSTAQREALYRFLGNERVTLDRLLAGHVAQTHERARAAGEVRIVHDTTTFRYAGEREGLGTVRGPKPGYFGHIALAVGATEERQAMGVLGILPYANLQAAKRHGMTVSQQVMYSQRLPREEKVTSRWERLALSVAEGLPAGVESIHVMDQEADDFAVLAELMRHKLRFVIRATGKRLTARVGQTLAQALQAKRGRVFRTVHVNRRELPARPGHPLRTERDAQLFLRWARVTLPKPKQAQSTTPHLTLNVVHVYEPHPPQKESGIEWFLLTTDSTDTFEEAVKVVDHYRARWVIEEYFKALKTGCAIEKRQLTSYEALVRALGLLAPIAWRLLLLRQLARAPRSAPASELFDEEDLKLLHVLLSKHRTDHHLPTHPTARDAMLAIAAIGGHIPQNGEPGWIVLGRGFQTFTDAQAVWHAARCDQS